MMNSDEFLQSLDFERQFPHSIIEHIIKGGSDTDGIQLGVMFDVDEQEILKSKGTGKVYYSDINNIQSYCKLLNQASVSENSIDYCANCRVPPFNKAKSKFLYDYNYKGEFYYCSEGGLRLFVVPIVEKINNTFLGVIFGGPKRPAESNKLAKKRLTEFVSQKINGKLRSISFRRLFKEYLKVPDVSNEKYNEFKILAEKMSNEIGMWFELIIKLNVAEKERRLENKLLKRIYQTLIKAVDYKTYVKTAEKIIRDLTNWSGFDGAMVVESLIERGAISIKIVNSSGIYKRLGNFREKNIAISRAQLEDANRVKRNPKFLSDQITQINGEKGEIWWIPVLTTDKSILGGIILGTSLNLFRNYKDEFQRKRPRLEEIARMIATHFEGLRGLRKEREKTKQLEYSRRQEKEARKELNDKILQLTHQMNRPLSMIHAILSSIRQFPNQTRENEKYEMLDVGILVLEHTHVLSKGISKSLAMEQGANITFYSETIDVKDEIRKLSDALIIVSERKDVNIKHFEEQPKIDMDRDSFLYVTYTLIDNAIKYADPNSTINIIWGLEKKINDYAIKIISKGLPIPPDQVKNVFKKFWRHDLAVRYDDTGIGIGCWAARRLMAVQGGDLYLRVDGRLSVFVVVPPQILEKS